MSSPRERPASTHPSGAGHPGRRRAGGRRGDFAHAAAIGPDPARLEDLYAVALTESPHAARWSQRVGWTARHDHAVTARQVPVVLGTAMSAARADDPAGLTEATRAVRAVHASLSRYRIPDPAR